MEMKHESHASAVSQQLNSRHFWVVTVNAFHRTGDLKLQRDPLNPRRLTQYNRSSWGTRFFRPEGASPTNRCIIWQGNVKKDLPGVRVWNTTSPNHQHFTPLLQNYSRRRDVIHQFLISISDVAPRDRHHGETRTDDANGWTVQCVHVLSKHFLSFLPVIGFFAPLLSLACTSTGCSRQCTFSQLAPSTPLSPALQTVDF